MQAYRLRHRVAFEYPVETVGKKGFKQVTWLPAMLGDVPLNSVPAEVFTGAGREPIADNAKQAETTLRVNLRWFPGLLETWRLIWDGNIYDISSIETDATARREYRLRCTGGLTSGQ